MIKTGWKASWSGADAEIGNPGLSSSGQGPHDHNAQQTHLEILKQIIHARLHIQRIQPERKHACFSFALCIEIFYGRRLRLFQWRESWPGIEQIRDKGQIQFWISRHQRTRCKETSTSYSVGALQDLFGALVQILRLQGCARAFVRFELVQEDSVIFAIRDVARKVLHPDMSAISG